MTNVNDDVPPNGDPQETAGPSGSEVDGDKTEFDQAAEANGDQEIDFPLRAELAEQFPLERIAVGTSSDDGLPLPMDGARHLPLAPQFGPATVACLEDTSEYVEVSIEDDAYLLDEVMPEWVSRMLYPDDYADPPSKGRRRRVERPQAQAPAGADAFVPVRSMFDAAGSPIERRVFKPGDVVKKWEATFAKTDDGWVRVRPKRMRCINYKRMVFANDDTAFKPGEFGHMVLYRNCTARRSVGGALMSIANEAVYACDHRDPIDPVTTEKYLDEPDRRRTAAKVEMVPLFNLPEN